MTNDLHEPGPPVIRYAPLGELRVYTVHEHELEVLAQGSPASIYLNFALALLPVAITLFVALITTPVPPGYLYQAFVCVCAMTLIAGIVLLVLWSRQRSGAKALIQQIKNRMPPPEGIQEPSQ